MKFVTNRVVLSLLLALGVISLSLFIYQRLESNKLPGITLKVHKRGGYSLYVDNKPYVVKGVCYLPTPVGKGVEYNFWANDDIWKTDAKLMKSAGVNTVRFYSPGKNPDEVKKVISHFYSQVGIRSLLGHDLGFWDWPPPNYGLAEFREKTKEDVLNMVREYKDEPGILAWILGNENNYSFEVLGVQSWSTPEIEKISDPNERRKAKAKIYYSFVNDIAKAVKEIDPVRPVIMGTGEIQSLHMASDVCPDVDIVGINVYRGKGFGNLFRKAQQSFDRPILLIEWGADSYDALAQREDQEIQADFIRTQWYEIERNLAGKKGKGNCLGGTLFEWTDEWWKGNQHVASTWSVHDTSAQASNQGYYHDYDVPSHLNMNEEWFGVVGIAPSSDKQKMDKRLPKKAYYTLKELWT